MSEVVLKITNEYRKLLEQEANDIDDRVDDLLSINKEGIVDELIEAQLKELEFINNLISLIDKYEGECKNVNNQKINT